MMTCEQIYKDIEETQCCYIFDYKNQPCGIDPWWDGNQNYNVWCGEKNFVAKSWEEVITTNLFDGKSLKEIIQDIENYEQG